MASIAAKALPMEPDELRYWPKPMSTPCGRLLVERSDVECIYRLIKTLPMGPEEIAVLTDAYEHTLRKLNLVERSDPITQLIAKKIIEIHPARRAQSAKTLRTHYQGAGVE